jgi:hypothetical protein
MSAQTPMVDRSAPRRMISTYMLIYTIFKINAIYFI